MRIIIYETGEEKELKLIDPTNGVDWSEDFICNSSDMIYTENGDAIMTEEEYNLWSDFCKRQNENDEYRNNLSYEERDLFDIVLVDALYGVNDLDEILKITEVVISENKARRN